MSNEIIVGHNDFLYRLVPGWGILDADKYPVKDCHEMVMAADGLLYMLTNEVRNNVLVYTKDGKLAGAWTKNFTGAHGLSIGTENGTEFLLITDTDSHRVVKTSLTGDLIMEFPFPREAGYSNPDEYKPTETAVAANGDIYVTDGYGLQKVIRYNSQGNYLQHWGGRREGDVYFDCVHGIAIDNRGAEPTLLITSRNENAWKRFTMDGEYLSTIDLPGSFVCRPVVHGKNIYGAVFRSETNQLFGSGYILCLDENNKVVSAPGGTEPVYKNEMLQAQRKEGNLFTHPHDVCVDDNEDLYIPQWNSAQTYPVKLERIR